MTILIVRTSTTEIECELTCACEVSSDNEFECFSVEVWSGGDFAWIDLQLGDMKKLRDYLDDSITLVEKL